MVPSQGVRRQPMVPSQGRDGNQLWETPPALLTFGPMSTAVRTVSVSTRLVKDSFPVNSGSLEETTLPGCAVL
jgi:hypothetical protein